MKQMQGALVTAALAISTTHCGNPPTEGAATPAIASAPEGARAVDGSPGRADEPAALTLTALSLSPSSVDATQGPALLRASFGATASSGEVATVYVGLRSPSGGQSRSCSWNAGGSPAATVSGNCDISFDPFVEAGLWVISTVYLYDAAGNARRFSTQDLEGAGFSTSIDVISNQDSALPSLQGFALSPSSIDTTDAPATVQASFTASDASSGIATVYIGVESPSGGEFRGCTWNAPAGTSPEVVQESCSLPFAQFGEGGAWRVKVLRLQDAAGNARSFSPSELEAQGFAATLAVTSTKDATGPALQSFSLSSDVVDTSSGPASVRVSFAAADDGAGIKTISVDLQSPSSAQSRGCYWSRSDSTYPKSVSDGCDLTFAGDDERGRWVVGNVRLYDALGNARTLAAADLQAAGFSSALQVTPGP